MKKIFKCKNLFLVTFLAIAGFFSAGAAISNSLHNNISSKEAKAYIALPEGKRVFLNMSSGVAAAGAVFKIKYSNISNKDAHDTSIEHDVTRIGTSDWYYFDLEYEASYFCIVRYNPAGGVWNMTDGDSGWGTEYAKPVIQYQSCSGTSDRTYYMGALPQHVYIKGVYNGWESDELTWNDDTCNWETYFTVNGTGYDNRFCVYGDVGSSPEVYIPYNDIKSQPSGFSGSGNDIYPNTAASYKLTVGPNFWSYGDKKYIWDQADGSNIVRAYTVTINKNNDSWGTVSSSSILSATGKTVSTSTNTFTVDGQTVTATPSPASSQYTYAFSSWTNATGTITADRTITANFSRTENNVTMTYKYVVDGVVQDKTIGGSGWQSLSDGSISAPYSTPLGNLTEPTYGGCSFDGWFSDANCKNGISGDQIHDHTTSAVYAKFTSLSTNKNIYVGIDSGSEYNKWLCPSWSADTAGETYIVCFGAEDVVLNVVKTKEMRTISVAGWKFFSFYIPSDTVKFVVCKGQWGTSSPYDFRCQTQDFYPTNGSGTNYSNGKNLLVIPSSTHNNTYETREGRWDDIVYYLDVSTSSSFASSVTTTNMNTPSNPSSRNVAEMMNVSIPASEGTPYYSRVRFVADGNEGNIKTEGGEDGESDSSKWTYSKQDTNGIKFTSNLTLNFYVNDSGQIWLVNCGSIDTAGYIYLSTTYAASDLKIDCESSAGTAFSHAKLSSVTDVHSVSTLTFDNQKGMIKIPIYNLRGGTSPSTGASYSITLTDADNPSNNTAVTGVSVVTTSPIYHISLTTTVMSTSHTIAVNATNGAAAKVAYDIATTIQGMPNKSVCEIDPTTAGKLCAAYDTNSSNTKLTGASISTWSSIVGDQGENISMPSIRIQLGRIAGGNYVVGSIRSFSPYSLITGDGEIDSSVLLIIIASSISILSITALSVLMVKKRKSKEQ